MDPCRIRSYLQVACAGLGFEIGEIWWTSNEHGSSTVAAIEEKPPAEHGENGAIDKSGPRGKLRFVQLYTSKSYENRRSMLVTPPEDEKDNEIAFGADHDHHHHDHHHDHECTKDDLEKHVLSPRLVDAISQTAQVVWANTLKQEGLTGRSDIPLHTAVGMPVAVDAHGNMCVVVMFSPSNIQSTDEAMEYLQSISVSATSSNIPCLMPAFDKTEEIMHVPTSGNKNNAIRGHIMPQEATSLGEGVTARFVSMDDHRSGGSTRSNNINNSDNNNNKTEYDLASAPKDCFGIPMLPCFAELRNPTATPAPAPTTDDGRASPTYDIFDEASFGVWSTIMQERTNFSISDGQFKPNNHRMDDDSVDLSVDNSRPMGLNEGNIGQSVDDDVDPVTLVTRNKPTMDGKRKERLEEFCSAFLGMSVFDIADVWISAGTENPDCVSHVVSICDNNQSNAVSEFKRVSGYTLIKFWSGAVGRAYSSGNPVWSCNPDVFIDKGRAEVFQKANIQTVFAVPIVVAGRATPVAVVCCYSMIQSGSVPFVLRFVQQALHLLWSGLDKVQPHESVGQEMWQVVGPADLGEMAADVEMQHHFLSKKRPRSDSIIDIGDVSDLSYTKPDESTPLQTQFKDFDFANKDDEIRYYSQQNEADESQFFRPDPQMTAQAYQTFQNHIKEAVKQVGEALPFSHNHIATTQDGSKRAHLTQEVTHTAQHYIAPQPSPPVRIGHPLAKPNALPRHVVKPSYSYESRVDVQNLSPQLLSTSSQITKNLAGGRDVQGVSSAAAPQTTVNNDFSQALPQQSMQARNGISGSVRGDSVGQGTPVQNPLVNQQSFPQYGGQSQQQQPQYHNHQPLHQTLDLGSYSGENIPFSTISPPQPGMNANSMQQQEEPFRKESAYGIPASSGTYPAPDEATSTFPGPLPTGKNDKAKVCRVQGCEEPCVARRPYCMQHNGNRLCEHAGCEKCAQGSTRFCIAHGGGRRCTFPGCDKGARDKFFCAAHGGGKRCKADGCNKSAVGGSSLCTAHGGGRRCSVEGCDKSAQSSTKFCVKHGGGKKCAHEDCEKVARGRTQYCAAHGGGIRCKLEGCNRVAIGKMQLCRAHGGGSRARSTKNSAYPANLPMRDNNGMIGDEQLMPPQAYPNISRSN